MKADAWRLFPHMDPSGAARCEGERMAEPHFHRCGVDDCAPGAPKPHFHECCADDCAPLEIKPSGLEVDRLRTYTLSIALPEQQMTIKGGPVEAHKVDDEGRRLIEFANRLGRPPAPAPGAEGRTIPAWTFETLVAEAKHGPAKLTAVRKLAEIVLEDFAFWFPETHAEGRFKYLSMQALADALGFALKGDE